MENKIQVLNDNELEDVVGDGAGKTLGRVVVKGTTTVVGVIVGGTLAFGTGLLLGDVITLFLDTGFRSTETRLWMWSCAGTTASIGAAGFGRLGYEFGNWLVKKSGLEEK